MATPYLTRFPSSLDPSPFSTTIRYREAIPTSPEPLPAWWDDQDEPLIYVTFGTVLGYMADATDVYRAALRAVENLDARVLMTVGRQFDSSLLGPIPRQVHVEAWVDQARVFGHAELVVTHCASGTALGSLAAGVPIVAAPLFADQLHNSRRIAVAGAGVIVEGRRAQDAKTRAILSEHDSPNLAAAIDTVLEIRTTDAMPARSPLR